MSDIMGLNGQILGYQYTNHLIEANGELYSCVISISTKSWACVSVSYTCAQLMLLCLNARTETKLLTMTFAAKPGTTMISRCFQLKRQCLFSLLCSVFDLFLFSFDAP